MGFIDYILGSLRGWLIGETIGSERGVERNKIEWDDEFIEMGQAGQG